MYFSLPEALRHILHFVPVENPAPPRQLEAQGAAVGAGGLTVDPAVQGEDLRHAEAPPPQGLPELRRNPNQQARLQMVSMMIRAASSGML